MTTDTCDQQTKSLVSSCYAPLPRANGYVLYRGPSKIDGKPIVMIATGFKTGSGNVKTGAMIQTWILREDVEPHTAQKTGDDESICGNCPHRGGSCYVVTFQAPLAIYRAYHRGIYPTVKPSQIATLFADKVVRFGAYGDPFAIPVAIWKAIATVAKARTGYTHQWKRAPYLRQLVMASVDNEEEYHLARSKGWRTFRVRTPDAPLDPGEITCPASHEGGQRTTCADCTLCDGARSEDGRKAVSIIVHGRGAGQFVA